MYEVKNNYPQLIRKAEVLARLGIKKTAFYQKIHEGVFPPPISLGKRSVAWVDREVNDVIKAIIAGKNHDEMKLLVSDLISKRTESNEW